MIDILQTTYKKNSSTLKPSTLTLRRVPPAQPLSSPSHGGGGLRHRRRPTSEHSLFVNISKEIPRRRHPLMEGLALVSLKKKHVSGKPK